MVPVRRLRIAARRRRDEVVLDIPDSLPGSYGIRFETHLVQRGVGYLRGDPNVPDVERAIAIVREAFAVATADPTITRAPHPSIPLVTDWSTSNLRERWTSSTQPRPPSLHQTRTVVLEKYLCREYRDSSPLIRDIFRSFLEVTRVPIGDNIQRMLSTFTRLDDGRVLIGTIEKMTHHDIGMMCRMLASETKKGKPLPNVTFRRSDSSKMCAVFSLMAKYGVKCSEMRVLASDGTR
jgi:hypothetical protein